MTTRLLLLAGDQPAAGRMVEQAAGRVFPSVQLQVIKGVEAARATPPDDLAEFLVLINPSKGEINAALETTDAHSLPRWPLLVLGSRELSNQTLLALPPEEWNPSSIERAIQTALLQHAARRDCFRARGDLKTIAQRLNHDLRAHMGGVLSAAELLQELIGSGTAPKTSQLKPIFDSTDGTVKLLDRISLVTRASAEPRKRTIVNVGMAFWAASQRLEMQIMRKQSSVVQPPTWPDVLGVMDWLEVVWWNLLANALDHAGPDTRISCGWEENSDETRFWLKDNGKGVPVEKRATLFHPLHRLHEPNAPSGLGLSIVHRLVELQKGTCGYEPLPEGGSRFHFSLPTSAS